MNKSTLGNQTVLQAIGNTPIVKLSKVPAPNSADVYVKLEYYNPTGSYKDRMALAIIEEAERRGSLRPGMTVIECTGGSTGSSLALVCAVKGYRFHVVSSNAFSKEKLQTMRAFGATLELVHSPSGMITPDLIPSMMRRAEELAKAKDTYNSNQFYNRDSLVGYENIGKELLVQLPQGVDAFCGGVGIAGMLMGTARALRRARPSTRIIALEPASAAIISTGKPGTHHVEGLGVGFIPPLLDKALYDEAWGIEESEARTMCRRLAREEGIFAGTSTGVNVVGALRLASQLGQDHTVATVAVDTGLKYLDGDLYRIDGEE
jgi:cysteine synthase